ncbi:hypothetical protein BDN72DRAFT_738276, partial [Pluteus cervinus]
MIMCLLGFLPGVAALGKEMPFPNITFAAFSKFILDHFDSHITLSTVLLLLFSMTENTDLLNLHARQRSSHGSKRVGTSWMRALAKAVLERAETDQIQLLPPPPESNSPEEQDNPEVRITSLCSHLDNLADLLSLLPVDNNDKFTKDLKPVSQQAIKAVYIICPQSSICQTQSCILKPLQQVTRKKDLPLVTLIKDFEFHTEVPLLSGQCLQCKTYYYADHEKFPHATKKKGYKVYLNTARYIKIGAITWVDRKFTLAVLNGMYNFHGSTSAYAEFWNQTFWQMQATSACQISHRQIWMAFLQESIRTIASTSGINFVLEDGVSAEEVAKGAYQELGEKGMIRAADGHSCEECTHQYKATPDVITQNAPIPSTSSDEEPDAAPVKMVVVDGIVMGPKHCSFDDCTEGLKNDRGGVFCEFHERQHGNKCRVVGCSTIKKQNTQACETHQGEWQTYSNQKQFQGEPGYRRALRRTDNDWDWVPHSIRGQPAHDADEVPETGRKNYFSPSKFYCVETIVAPCGVVIAWALFDKAEGPNKILEFLEEVFPTADSKPDYVTIDKGCTVLRTAVAGHHWDIWKDTTRFIVDSYHYNNHKTTDILCRTYCDPAPSDGSAPNLVIAKMGPDGLYFQRAFNTQACEQLNAWIGGFQAILNRMKIYNFNWLLHSMLFVHTQRKIQKQEHKKRKAQ